MDVTGLSEQLQRALLLSAVVSLPVVAIAAVVGLLVATLQSVTQIQDATVSHLARLIAVVGALVVFGPWMARQIGAYAEQVFSSIDGSTARTR